MTALWIIVGIFVVVAIGAGLAQIFTAWGDKRISDDVTHDRGRLHADPSKDLDEDASRDLGGEADEHGDH